MKKDSKHYCQAVNPERGRCVVVDYLPSVKGVVLYIKNRLTPILMGKYRSISELNKNSVVKVRLSPNRRALIHSAVLTGKTTLGLITCLDDVKRRTEGFSVDD